MRTLLEQSVLDSIRATRLFVPGDRVGVAVSGGGDSVALLRLLETLRGDLGITPIAVHFDHGLRGNESDGDARFVATLARELGIEFILGREDVAAAAAQNGWNLEDAGRRLRYEFFRRLVEDGRATRIAVAHSADDQAETVLAHIMRGTGPSGLAGIYPEIGRVVRPLLSIRRETLRAYLREIGQSWREDSTNKDASRTRAKIRQQLLPVIERDFSPQIVGHLSELSRLAREEGQFWTALVEDRFNALVRLKDETLSIGIDDLLSPLGSSIAGSLGMSEQFADCSADLSTSLRPLTERLIRRFYEILRGDRKGLGAAHVEQVIRLAAESSSGRGVQLPDGVRVEKRFRELIFSRISEAQPASNTLETTSLPIAYQYVIELPSRGKASVPVPELGTCFSLKVVDWPIAASETKQREAALDAELLFPPLILRNWHPGDAYRPRGHRNTRKLKQMFLAGRIPSGKRSEWPVLESAGRVVWTRGMPPADEFSAREGTRAGLMIEEYQL
jgi:tRNA(Ile)-lysidine synthase